MNKYVYNPNKCPQMVGTHTFHPQTYGVADDRLSKVIKEAQIPVTVEGDPEFPVLWVENKPDKTPNMIP